MEAYAIAKGVRIAPRKARMTMDLIRGKDVFTAEAILENTNTKASRLIYKVLESAIYLHRSVEYNIKTFSCQYK